MGVFIGSFEMVNDAIKYCPHVESSISVYYIELNVWY